MKEFIISKNDAGQRLDRFISKVVPSLSPFQIQKYIRTKHIKINRKKAANSTRLNEDDTVQIFLNDEYFINQAKKFEYDFLKAGKELDIVYEDDNIIILNKPAGLLCHPDKKEYDDNLINRLKRYLYAKGEYDPQNDNSFSPSLANRIDRNTKGLVIGAKNAESLRILNQKIKSREIEKQYFCLAHGRFEKDEDTLTAYLTKNEKTNTVTVSDSEIPGSQKIVTRYRILGYKDGISRVSIDLLTGRTHQIRAHLAHIGHPIVGDKKYIKGKYNDAKSGYFHQELCSYKLKFRFKTDAGILDYLKDREFTADKNGSKK